MELIRKPFESLDSYLLRRIQSAISVPQGIDIVSAPCYHWPMRATHWQSFRTGERHTRIRTRLFDWAQGQGLGLAELSELTGYSERHLMRIRDGHYPVTDSFRGQVILRMGDWARSLFLPQMSDTSDVSADPLDAEAGR